MNWKYDRSKHDKIKRTMSLKVPLLGIGFYVIWTAVVYVFFGKAEYYSGSFLLFLLLLLIFPSIFGVYGYIKNRSVIMTCIYFFIITFIYFLFSFAYSISKKPTYGRPPNVDALSEAPFIALMLTIECFVFAVITKIIIIIKEKTKLREGEKNNNISTQKNVLIDKVTILSIYELYDLHAVLVNIRYKPAYELNNEVIKSVLSVLKGYKEKNDVNQVRKSLSYIKGLDQEMYSFAYVENRYTYFPSFIKDEKIYNILIESFEELLFASNERNYKKVDDLADCLHNLPIIIAENKFSIPNNYFKNEVMHYRNTWNESFLKEAEKGWK